MVQLEDNRGLSLYHLLIQPYPRIRCETFADSYSRTFQIFRLDFPPRQESTDKDGVTTIIEYRLNDEGKKVKVTRKIKRTLTKTSVNHVVAERMGWAKSVNSTTTSLLRGTDVSLVLASTGSDKRRELLLDLMPLRQPLVRMYDSVFKLVESRSVSSSL